MDNPNVRLLVVDDEASQLRALCATLSAQGYHTTGCANGRQALAALEGGSFDLLLTDLMMPDMDGISVLRAVLARDPSIVGILMTGEGTIATAVQAMQSGALDYILKPFNLSTILPVISRALSVRRLRLENAALEKRVREHAAELLETNKHLEAFAYSVSHDLRSPLNAVIGYSSLLLEHSRPPLESHARVWVEHIRWAGQSMNARINDLMSLFQVSRCEFAQGPVDLSALAWETIQTLRAGDPQRKVEVEIDEALTVQGDAGLLKLVLDNLLGNAWKYTSKRADARIEFRLLHARDAAAPVYAVRDNGAGFDMAKEQLLFEPFRRLHSEAEFAGTGIGLSIVQRAILRHGGRVWADAAVGQGATFYFTLNQPAAA